MTARVTSIQLLPVLKPRKESIFSLYNKTFLLLNVRCEAKGNVSVGIKGLVILLKGKCSFHFVHNTAARGLLVFELCFLTF